MNSSVVSPGRAGFTSLLTGQMLPLDRHHQLPTWRWTPLPIHWDASVTQLELIAALYGVSLCPAMAKTGDNHGCRRLFMWGRAFGLCLCCAGMANSSAGCWRPARRKRGRGADCCKIPTTLHVTLSSSAPNAR